MQANSDSTPREVKEYHNLALVNDNLYQANKNNSKELPQFNKKSNSTEELVKIGNFYVKKNSLNIPTTTNNNVSFTNKNSSSMNDSLVRKPGFSVLERCDRNVKEDPQYVVEFVKEIFINLKEVEVKIDFLLYF